MRCVENAGRLVSQSVENAGRLVKVFLGGLNNAAG